MIFLEAMREKNNLKIGVKKPGDPISSYKEKPVDVEKIEDLCIRIFEMLNKSSRKGNGGSEALKNLRDLGGVLCNELLTANIKNELKQTCESHLIVNPDDHLVHIPWELMCLDEDFLCQCFNMGRNARTQQDIIRSNERQLANPLSMWVLADPKGDLASAATEGLDICDCMDLKNQGNSVDAILESEITLDKIGKEIRNYDFVHYAGHADYNSQNPGQSGWNLKVGILKASDIKKMEGGPAMPVLVFSNACQSARTGEWKWKEDGRDDSFGLANAFMLAGVKHYIGTSWEIRDESGSLFALEFYKCLLSGRTVGEAVKLARLGMIKDGADTCWASYILYGDPSIRYFEEARESVDLGESETGAGQEHIKLNDIFQKNKGKPIRSEKEGSDQVEIKDTLESQLEQSLLFSFPKKWVLYLATGVILGVIILGVMAGYFKRSEPMNKPIDEWTSMPLHMTVVFDSKGFNPEMEDIISAAIEIKLLEYPRIHVVDRMTLKMTLDEMELNKSEWIDPAKKLDPGRMLPADFRLNIKVNNSGPDPAVQMRLIDNETGDYLDVFSKKFRENESIIAQKDFLSRELLDKLKSLYPLRGRILEASGRQARLNIGSDVGVRVGQRFRLVGKDVILKVVSAKKDTSVIGFEKGGLVLEKGWRVQSL